MELEAEAYPILGHSHFRFSYYPLTFSNPKSPAEVNELVERKRVGLWPATLCQEHQPLWHALENLFPLTFAAWTPKESPRLDALLAAASGPESGLPAVFSQVASYVFNGLPTKPDGGAAGNTLKFALHTAIPLVFRGRTMADTSLPHLPALPVGVGSEVLATQAGRPVWVYHPAAGVVAARDVVSLPLPELGVRGLLRDCFNGGNYLRALPLLAFLQRLTASAAWQPAPLRACFVFDDPSLRRETYGFIHYRRLAQHALRWNYHAAIGMIPLASASVNPVVRAVFREHPGRLSLTVHGCYHLRQEMARCYGPADRLALCAEALRRVAAFERKSGLAVCQVMESPHGVIDRGMFGALLALGYEATLITPRQFLQHDTGADIPPCFGLQSVCYVDGGLGMIPRITIQPHWRTEATLAAFLGQPIVIAGHHQDAANDLEALSDIAQTVNAFGPVRWCSLSEIARSNYATRVEGTTLTVCVGSRRTVLPLPAGVRKVRICRPWLGTESVEPLMVTGGKAGLQFFAEQGVGLPVLTRQQAGAESSPVEVNGLESIEVYSPVTEAVDPDDVPPPPRRLWPYARRVLTEVRDRVRPFLVVPKPTASSMLKTKGLE